MSQLIMKKLVEIDACMRCWNWLWKVSDKTGYGQKQSAGKSCLAHRWMYEIFNGPIQKDKVLDHLCRNRKCCNPEHLEPVSQSANCRRGEGATLTASVVALIKVDIAQSKWGGRQAIADRYGVSAATISDIKHGRSWADVKPFTF